MLFCLLRRCLSSRAQKSKVKNGYILTGEDMEKDRWVFQTFRAMAAFMEVEFGEVDSPPIKIVSPQELVG